MNTDSNIRNTLSRHGDLYVKARTWYMEQLVWIPRLYNMPPGTPPIVPFTATNYHYHDNDTHSTSPAFHYATALLLAINRLHILTNYHDQLYDVANCYTPLDVVYEFGETIQGKWVALKHYEFTDIIRCTDLDEMTDHIYQLMDDPMAVEVVNQMKEISSTWWEQSELSWTFADQCS
jgi:hypothetical protein